MRVSLGLLAAVANVRKVLWAWGGFALSVGSLQRCCHSADTDPARWLCVHIRVIRGARHFTSTSTRVESDTLKMAPRHINHAIADTICLMNSRGDGSTSALCQSFASR